MSGVKTLFFWIVRQRTEQKMLSLVSFTSISPSQVFDKRSPIVTPEKNVALPSAKDITYKEEDFIYQQRGDLGEKLRQEKNWTAQSIDRPHSFIFDNRTWDQTVFKVKQI